MNERSKKGAGPEELLIYTEPAERMLAEKMRAARRDRDEIENIFW